MAQMCDKVILACAYCETTQFQTTKQLERHWKNCSSVCAKDCKCKKCSPIYCETKLENALCIEYCNEHTMKKETLLTFFKRNKRHLFFPLKEIFNVKH